MTLTPTGNVGIGTPSPGKTLHVQGHYSAPLMNDGNDRPGVAITGDYPQLDLFSGVNNGNHGATIRLGAYNDDNKTSFQHWVIGTAGRNAAFLDIGYSANNDANPHAGIRNYNGQTILSLSKNGNVGIGTTAPEAKLDVRGAIRAGNSDLYFTEPNHNHSGIGNAAGYAAIENARDYDALMILGRAGTSVGRKVRLWDYLEVNGRLDVTGNVRVGDEQHASILDVYGDIKLRGNPLFEIKVYHELTGNEEHDTGYSTRVWAAVIAGFYCTAGTIATGGGRSDIIDVFMVPHDNWHIFADFRSTNIHENWNVAVLFIRRELCGTIESLP